jgi:thiamine-monophosphate kinase
MTNDIKSVEEQRLGEFEIIARYFAPLATDRAALGLRDDAAVLVVSEGLELIATCDTLVEGVHFLKGDPPDSIGHKALAVSLSDLAAKGARSYAYLLSVALPSEISLGWLEGFSSGLRALQEKAGIVLVGGDTTSSPGPLTVTTMALGLVPHGHAVLRHGAKVGDRLYVSGTIGDAYLGLRLLKDPVLAPSWGLSEEDVAFLIDRYRRPKARTDLVLLIRNFAQAAIDISDGLVGDIEKLCQVSHVGALIEVTGVPFSAAARKALTREPQLLEVLLGAGDDYEVVAAVPQASIKEFEAEARAKGRDLTQVGRLEGKSGEVHLIGPDGAPFKVDHKGFTHF